MCKLYTTTTAIGANSLVTASQSMVLGGTGNNALNVGIGVNAPATTLDVNGYTKLGPSSPHIATVKLTGLTASSQGGISTINHGLTLSKILSVSVLVEASSATLVPDSYTVLAGYEFDFRINTTGVILTNHPSNSAFVISKPVRILITYEE